MRIEIHNLSRAFGGTTAVDTLNAEIEDGELVCILGPSGCGKTTTLNMLGGVLPPTAGQILFDGVDVTTLPAEKRSVGFVFQNYALYPHLSVAKNIEFPLSIARVAKKERRARVASTAALVQVEALLDRKPSELSGGQQQRVAIARALVKRPQLLLLDEPLSNLDARLRLEMRAELRRIQQETGVTTVFVTHDQDEAMAISDRIMLMNAGRLEQFGAPQDLYDDPETLFAATFIGSPPINQLTGFIGSGVFTLPDGGEIPGLLGEQVDIADAIVGIRAEAVRVDPRSPQVWAKVVSVVPQGREVYAEFALGEARLRATVARHVAPSLSVADKTPLAFDPSGVLVFDARTGARRR